MSSTERAGAWPSSSVRSRSLALRPPAHGPQVVFVRREGHHLMLLDQEDAAVHSSSRDADFRFPPSDTSYMLWERRAM